jgi:general secretion pathway protein I
MLEIHSSKGGHSAFRGRPLSWSQKGFTLIEILVAMSVLSISLVVVFQVFSGGLKSSKLSERYTRAIFYAREKMEEILLSDELTEAVTEGEFEDSFKWKAEVALVEPIEEDEPKLPFDIFNIKVDVWWEDMDRGKHFEISTTKIAEKSKDNETSARKRKG